MYCTVLNTARRGSSQTQIGSSQSTYVRKTRGGRGRGGRFHREAAALPRTDHRPQYIRTYATGRFRLLPATRGEPHRHTQTHREFRHSNSHATSGTDGSSTTSERKKPERVSGRDTRIPQGEPRRSRAPRTTSTTIVSAATLTEHTPTLRIFRHSNSHATGNADTVETWSGRECHLNANTKPHNGERES